jgi:hypothetical protein
MSIKIAKNFQNTDEVKNMLHFLTEFYLLLPPQTPVIWQFCRLHSKGVQSGSPVGVQVMAVRSILQHIRDAVHPVYCTLYRLPYISLRYFLAVFKLTYMTHASFELCRIQYKIYHRLTL